MSYLSICEGISTQVPSIYATAPIKAMPNLCTEHPASQDQQATAGNTLAADAAPSHPKPLALLLCTE